MLTIEELAIYCLNKKAAEKTFPFGPDTVVYKVMGKMFALHSSNEPVDSPSVNLKCDPDWSIMLRQHYTAVAPGYHMNKKHWNTVTLDGTIPGDEIREMIDHSYTLVVKSLKRSDRDQLAELPG